jgi:hypothetical protein
MVHSLTFVFLLVSIACITDSARLTLKVIRARLPPSTRVSIVRPPGYLAARRLARRQKALVRKTKSGKFTRSRKSKTPVVSNLPKVHKVKIRLAGGAEVRYNQIAGRRPFNIKYYEKSHAFTHLPAGIPVLPLK